MKPIVLIVEDNETALRGTVELFQMHGMSVITAADVDEVATKLAFAPNIDLVVCDWNLNNDEDGDDSGVKVGSDLRRAGFKQPMALVSGRDSVDLESRKSATQDLRTDSDRPFNFVARKSDFNAGLEERLVSEARAHMISKYEDAKQSISGGFGQNSTLNSSIRAVVSFVPGMQVHSTSNDDYSTADEIESHAVGYETNIRKAGFRAALIDGVLADEDGKPIVSVVSPFVVWFRDLDSRITVDVVGCSRLCIDGTDQDEALRNLAYRMKTGVEEGDVEIGQFVQRHVTL